VVTTAQRRRYRPSLDRTRFADANRVRHCGSRGAGKDLSNIADQAEREKSLQNLISQELLAVYFAGRDAVPRSNSVLAVDTAWIVFTGHHIVCAAGAGGLDYKSFAPFIEEISGAPVAAASRK